MSNIENELKDLREQNNDLVQKVQYWKVAAAQKDNDKLKVMKEANELRLKLSTLRNKGTANAQKLYAALQSASEEALSHLVQASNKMARILELMKGYMQDRENMEYTSQWSNLSNMSNTPSAEKVHRVPPLLLGGKSIQPVVSLSRTVLTNNSGDWSSRRSSNQSHNSSTVRAMPMHMLQDVYIPLTRIDAGEVTSNDVDMENHVANNSTEDLELDDSDERVHEEEPNNSIDDDSDGSRRLDAVTEEPEENDSPQRGRADPIEGPSWLLDGPSDKVNVRRGKHRMSLKPNILEYEELAPVTEPEVDRMSSTFTPTVRRKRASSPRPPSPAATPHAPAATPHTPASPVFSPRPRRNNNRILKVLVSKMRLDEDDSNDASPPKRPMTGDPDTRRSTTREAFQSRDITPETSKSPTGSSKSGSREEFRGWSDNSPVITTRIDRCPSFDAPSPNGSTGSRVIVLETATSPQRMSRRAARAASRSSRTSSASDTVSDSSGEPAGPRTRRARRPVVYKEKPLNRKLRR